MAFGLFKKKETGADSIFFGGKIFTQDPNNEWATAVACKNGKVLAVGDDENIMELEDESTIVVDLEGEYMLPGFIDPAGHPALEIFKKCSLYLDKQASLEEITTELTKYILLNPETETYFAYGFSPGLLEGKTLEEAAANLDQLDSPVPIVLLANGGNYVWINTLAIDKVKENAEKDKIPNITLPYILYILAPFDHLILEKESLALAEKYRTLGFTSVLSCGDPDYLQGVYQQCLVDMYQWGTLLQRYFGSLLVISNVSAKAVMQRLSQRKTICTELDDIFNFNMIKLIVDSSSGESSISLDTLTDLCNEAGDNGFDMHFDVIGPEAFISSIEAISRMRSAGYRKNTVVVAHAENIDLINKDSENPIDFQDLQIIESIPTIWKSSDLVSTFDSFDKIEDLIDFHTIHAAEKLGLESRLGQITSGCFADFTVFKTNPLEVDPKDFSKLTVSMTVINGKPTEIGDSSLEEEFFEELEDF
ncbi:MAG: amidohydrolase family protein, partial [Peptostreptococcaceae bacterium]|nr:amidohydrolase family protein [Peptostreptococcaceae bacterium]